MGLAARLRARCGARGRDPDRPPARAGEPALAVHPWPRGRGRADRPVDRAHGRGGDRPGARGAVRDDHDPSAEDDRHRADREDGVHALSKRTVLCFSLFVGQAFLYNAFFFTYGDTLTTFLGVGQTGWYLAAFAVSNFLGALLLGPLFDSIGRVRMITGTYVLSGVLLGVAGFLLGDLSAMSLTVFGIVIFFFASAGASAAYLTASEVFPMETRALCIAFFYAIGTAAGGISGPLLFGHLIDSASASSDITGIAPGYFLGAGLMIAGGIVEAFLGVRAERQSLESIAKPLTAEDAETGGQQAATAHA